MKSYHFVLQHDGSNQGTARVSSNEQVHHEVVVTSVNRTHLQTVRLDCTQESAGIHSRMCASRGDSWPIPCVQETGSCRFLQRKADASREVGMR